MEENETVGESGAGFPGLERGRPHGHQVDLRGAEKFRTYDRGAGDGQFTVAYNVCGAEARDWDLLDEVCDQSLR